MFNEQLKLLRNQKRISQAKLADELGVSASTVAMWESGERKPKNYETLEIIADYFNVNMEVLLTGKLAPTKIPVLGKVVAGIPLEAVEEIIDYEEIPQSNQSKEGTETELTEILQKCELKSWGSQLFP